MFYYNIHKVFKLRGITSPFKFLMDNGFSRGRAYHIVTYRFSALRLDTLERLCEILSCTPNDILEWIPSKDSIIPDSHPLHQLKAKEQLDVQSLIKDVPVTKLPELIKAIQEAKSKLN